MLNISTMVSLIELDVSCCVEITDLGLLHLKSLINLESLDIYGCCQITDDGLLHINTGIRELDIRGCRITKLGANYLRRLVNLEKLAYSYEISYAVIPLFPELAH